MKKVLSLLVLVLAVFGCSSGGDGAKQNINYRRELQQSSVLEKVQKAGKLKIGLEAGYLPFEFTDDKGNIIGFDIDLATLMAEELGVELQVVNTQWDGIIPGLQVGKYDIIMSGMTRTLKRALSVNFSDSYYETGQVIMLRKDETRFSDHNDLNKKGIRVATKMGTTSDISTDKVLKRVENVRYKTEADAAMALRQKKVDAFVYDKPYIEDYIEKNDSVKMLPELFTVETLGFAMRKGDPDFVQWVNLFLAQLRADGTYDELYNKWFIDKEYKK